MQKFWLFCLLIIPYTTTGQSVVSFLAASSDYRVNEIDSGRYARYQSWPISIGIEVRTPFAGDSSLALVDEFPYQKKIAFRYDLSIALRLSYSQNTFRLKDGFRIPREDIVLEKTARFIDAHCGLKGRVFLVRKMQAIIGAEYVIGNLLIANPVVQQGLVHKKSGPYFEQFQSTTHSLSLNFEGRYHVSQNWVVTLGARGRYFFENYVNNNPLNPIVFSPEIGIGRGL